MLHLNAYFIMQRTFAICLQSRRAIHVLPISLDGHLTRLDFKLFEIYRTNHNVTGERHATNPLCLKQIHSRGK